LPTRRHRADQGARKRAHRSGCTNQGRHGHGCTRKAGCDHHRCWRGSVAARALVRGRRRKVVVNDLGCAVNGSGDDRAALRGRGRDQADGRRGSRHTTTCRTGTVAPLGDRPSSFRDLHVPSTMRDHPGPGLVNMTRRSGTSSCTSTERHFVRPRWQRLLAGAVQGGPQDHSGCREHFVDLPDCWVNPAVELRDRKSWDRRRSP